MKKLYILFIFNILYFSSYSQDSLCQLVDTIQYVKQVDVIRILTREFTDNVTSYFNLTQEGSADKSIELEEYLKTFFVKNMTGFIKIEIPEVNVSRSSKKPDDFINSLFEIRDYRVEMKVKTVSDIFETVKFIGTRKYTNFANSTINVVFTKIDPKNPKNIKVVSDKNYDILWYYDNCDNFDRRPRINEITDVTSAYSSVYKRIKVMSQDEYSKKIANSTPILSTNVEPHDAKIINEATGESYTANKFFNLGKKGAYSFEISANGYVSQKVKLLVGDKGVYNLAVKLRKKTGLISIDSDPKHYGLSVKIVDGVTLGTLPIKNYILDFGIHNIKIEGDLCYDSKKIIVTLNDLTPTFSTDIQLSKAVTQAVNTTLRIGGALLGKILTGKDQEVAKDPCEGK